MSHPLVSVVIPTYNQPALLAETLDSVLAQTMRDFEVVVVNDGSTDNTADRLASYGDKIRVVTQPNAGIGAARNRGVDEARGKYVAPLDHDDLWLPKKLEVQVQYAEAHAECSAVSVPWAVSTAPDRPAFDFRLREIDGTLERPLLHFAHGDMPVVTSAILFRKERAAGLRYGTTRGAIEDVQFHIGLLSRGKLGIAGDDVLVIYRLHGTNHSVNPAYFDNGMKLLRQMERDGAFAEARGQVAEDVRVAMAHFGRTAALKQLRAGNRFAAARVYLREFPFQVQDRRAKFLIAFPAMLAAPSNLLHRF